MADRSVQGRTMAVANHLDSAIHELGNLQEAIRRSDLYDVGSMEQTLQRIDEMKEEVELLKEETVCGL